MRSSHFAEGTTRNSNRRIAALGPAMAKASGWVSRRRNATKTGRLARRAARPQFADRDRGTRRLASVKSYPFVARLDRAGRRLRVGLQARVFRCRRRDRREPEHPTRATVTVVDETGTKGEVCMSS